MKKMFLALILLPLLPGLAAAQGNADAGRMAWAGNQLQCRNCHGAQGQGGYAPDLAGRQLSPEQFKRAVRQPWGVMPAFIDKQISDETIADLAAYFGGLPRVAEVGAPRFATVATSPQGQKYIVESYGCANCHQPELRDPRRVLGGEAADVDFDFFAKRVYTHTEVYTDPVPRMGNFSRARVPESVLRDIYKFIKDDLGLLAPVVASMNAGAAADANTKYTVTLENQGTRGKGLAAETVTINLVLPTGASVVSNTGDGYQGVKKLMVTIPPAPAGRGAAPAGGGAPAPAPAPPAAPQQVMADVAVWQVPSIPAGTKQTYSVTLSGAAVPVAGFRGSTVKWLKPELRKALVNLEVRDPRTPDKDDVANVTFPAAGRGGAPAAAPAPARGGVTGGAQQ
jgi:mono/diheme cytochrome c family protein